MDFRFSMRRISSNFYAGVSAFRTLNSRQLFGVTSSRISHLHLFIIAAPLESNGRRFWWDRHPCPSSQPILHRPLWRLPSLPLSTYFPFLNNPSQPLTRIWLNRSDSPP